MEEISLYLILPFTLPYDSKYILVKDDYLCIKSDLHTIKVELYKLLTIYHKIDKNKFINNYKYDNNNNIELKVLINTDVLKYYEANMLKHFIFINYECNTEINTSDIVEISKYYIGFKGNIDSIVNSIIHLYSSYHSNSPVESNSTIASNSTNISANSVDNDDTNADDNDFQDMLSFLNIDDTHKSSIPPSINIDNNTHLQPKIYSNRANPLDYKASTFTPNANYSLNQDFDYTGSFNQRAFTNPVDDPYIQPIFHQMSLNNAQIGSIIGERGYIIRQIRSMSSAQIKISSVSDRDDDIRLVIVSGTPEQVRIALQLIQQRLDSLYDINKIQNQTNRPFSVTTFPNQQPPLATFQTPTTSQMPLFKPTNGYPQPNHGYSSSDQNLILMNGLLNKVPVTFSSSTITAPTSSNQLPLRSSQNVVTQNPYGSMISPSMFPTQLQRNVSQPNPSTSNASTASTTSATSLTTTTTLNQAAKPFTPSAKPITQGLVYNTQPFAKSTGMSSFMPPDLSDVNKTGEFQPYNIPKGNMSGHNTPIYSHTPASHGGEIYPGSSFPANYGSQKGNIYPNFNNIPPSTPPYYMPSVLSRQQTN